jgi:hypothetical protein
VLAATVVGKTKRFLPVWQIFASPEAIAWMRRMSCLHLNRNPGVSNASSPKIAVGDLVFVYTPSPRTSHFEEPGDHWNAAINISETVITSSSWALLLLVLHHFPSNSISSTGY